MNTKSLMAVMLLWPMFHLLPANAAIPDRQAIVDAALASKATSVDEPMRIVITEKDPANPDKFVDRDITVTDIPLYVRPTQKVGEALNTYLTRVVKAQEDHSKLKAERIAAAINTTLGAGRATVAQVNSLSATGSNIWNMVLQGGQKIPIKNGQITVSGAHKFVYGPSAALQKARMDDIKAIKEYNIANPGNKQPVPKPLTNNHTGEIGDGVRIQRGPGPVPPGGTSPGSRGSIGTMQMNLDLATTFPGEFPGVPMVATGLPIPSGSPPPDASGYDELLLPSIIEFGILGRYVASVNPYSGETDEQVYLALESLLDQNGLPATYDYLTHTLYLNGEFGEPDALYWSSTDTGFSEYLTVSYGISAVPEPGTALLLALALAAMGGISPRGRALVRRRLCLRPEQIAKTICCLAQ